MGSVATANALLMLPVRLHCAMYVVVSRHAIRGNKCLVTPTSRYRLFGIDNGRDRPFAINEPVDYETTFYVTVSVQLLKT